MTRYCTILNQFKLMNKYFLTENTKQYCKFPFVSPYTGVTWYRCAVEYGYDGDEFCMTEDDQLIECHREYISIQ